MTSYLQSLLTHIPANKQNQSIRSNLMSHLISYVGEEKCTVLDICRLCGNDFEKNQEKHVLVPTEKKNRFVRRQIRYQPNDGTLYQMRSAEKLDKYSVQKLDKYCPCCKYKFRRVIKNFQRSKNNVVIRNKEKEVIKKSTNEQIFRNTKKKKKKDFAGLKESAVLSAKRARGLINNSDDSSNTKKPKLDTKVIDLDSPIISPVKLNRHARRNNSFYSSEIGKEQLDSPDFISLVTPKNIKNKQFQRDRTNSNTSKIGNHEFDNPDFINLITPQSKIGNQQLENPDFISLVTPKKIKNKQFQRDRTNSNTPNTSTIGNKQFDNPDFISLITPESKTPNTDFKTRAHKMAIKKTNLNYKWRLKQINKLNTKKIDNASHNNGTPQFVKKKKSTKKSQKLNSLSYLLRDDNKLNKTDSKLEQFLNSIPTTN